ncbi:class I SAM-dependent methyltransferase [Streptomyces sp. MST-110588]|uniref:class I SAM-dependent methyltransferase n=1 Tax=Streptomyces sp. MST-110588 TaxID=2833628 RepID=UPI001F5DC715|nr:class I SAM-dependent methyltransferase [Streptomyces sp. MST-110588]UNO40575.1 methyltransferase domain-containing protein [Streptomyces sp. MST-110588]
MTQPSPLPANPRQPQQTPHTPQPRQPQPPRHSALARSFDSVATQYAAARPGYPPALFDALEALTGRPLAGARVLDVGAGTGIATRLLAGRGARVTAVEPGAAMAAELRAAAPGTPLVRALGDALPFADDAGFDLVTYAQAWHWTEPARSVPEAMRILRPGGALALWWNVPDPQVEWAAGQEARLARRLPGYHAHSVAPEAGALIRGLGSGPGSGPGPSPGPGSGFNSGTGPGPGPRPEPVRRVLRWTRRVPLDTHLAMLGSRSYFAAIGPEAARPVLEDERAELLKVFPDGVIEEAYALDVTVTLRPAASSPS